VTKLFKISKTKTLSELVIQKDVERMVIVHVVTSPVLRFQVADVPKCEESFGPSKEESSLNRPIQTPFKSSLF
jgi:hypothetical protein